MGRNNKQNLLLLFLLLGGSIPFLPSLSIDGRTGWPQKSISVLFSGDIESILVTQWVRFADITLGDSAVPLGKCGHLTDCHIRCTRRFIELRMSNLHHFIVIMNCM